MKISAFFDKLYSETERYWWCQPNRYFTNPEDHPASVVTQLLLRHLSDQLPGRALDLGSGEGADAIRLALLGWTVDAVELSSVGADKIRRFACQAGVDVAIHNVDAKHFESLSPYDLVICNGLLHYIPEKRKLVRKIQGRLFKTLLANQGDCSITA